MARRENAIRHELDGSIRLTGLSCRLRSGLVVRRAHASVVVARTAAWYFTSGMVGHLAER